MGYLGGHYQPQGNCLAWPGALVGFYNPALQVDRSEPKSIDIHDANPGIKKSLNAGLSLAGFVKILRWLKSRPESGFLIGVNGGAKPA